MEKVGELEFRGKSKEEIIEIIFHINKEALKLNKELIHALFLNTNDDKWEIVFAAFDSQEEKDEFWSEALQFISDNGIRAIIFVSDVTITTVESNTKKDALLLHYLDDEGTKIVKQVIYGEDSSGEIVFEEETSHDQKFLFYCLEPIAKFYDRKE